MKRKVVCEEEGCMVRGRLYVKRKVACEEEGCMVRGRLHVKRKVVCEEEGCMVNSYSVIGIYTRSFCQDDSLKRFRLHLYIHTYIYTQIYMPLKMLHKAVRSRLTTYWAT